MRKDMLICRCLKFFALQKIGMTILLIIRRFLDDCCRNRGMTPTLLSYLGNFSFLSYSGLSRVSRGFKWILGTSPRMTIKNVCPRMTPTLLSYSCLTRVSMDPRNKSEDDKRECVFEGDCYKKMSPSMTIMMWILVSSLTMTNMAHAECTPTLDCASIGYTETSCETTSLKCPFDTTKLKCLPCDSSFKYDCNGDNITGGSGTTCNGKYVSCECASGTTFNNGECVCGEFTLTDCLVGTIYYSNGKCSNDYISCQNPIGVVVKDNELVMSAPIRMVWGNYGTDVSGLTNISSSSTAKTDMNGKSNTSIIASEHSSSGLTSSNSAAIYCNSYSTDGTSVGDWYLPAAGELYSYVYGNYDTINPVATTMGWTYFDGYAFWSSSENSNYYAWHVDSDDGTMYDYGKANLRSVSCLLAL